MFGLFGRKFSEEEILTFSRLGFEASNSSAIKNIAILDKNNKESTHITKVEVKAIRNGYEMITKGKSYPLENRIKLKT